MTYSRERIKTIDLFPRTDNTHKNYARPISANVKSEKNIPDIEMMLSFHVETVVLLSRKRPDDKIEIDLTLDELDLTSAESKATYEEIKDYVLKTYGLKVSNLYISQVKRKLGLDVGKNYNLSKSDNPTVPECPLEKEKAITEALRHFGMI